MCSLFRLLKKIQENPLLWLGDESFSRLRFFMDGYLTCAQEHRDLASVQSFERLKTYIEKSFSPVMTDNSYYSYIKESCESEPAALKKFFALFDSFLAQAEEE